MERTGDESLDLARGGGSALVLGSGFKKVF